MRRLKQHLACPRTKLHKIRTPVIKKVSLKLHGFLSIQRYSNLSTKSVNALKMLACAKRWKYKPKELEPTPLKHHQWCNNKSPEKG